MALTGKAYSLGNLREKRVVDTTAEASKAITRVLKQCILWQQYKERSKTLQYSAVWVKERDPYSPGYSIHHPDRWMI